MLALYWSTNTGVTVAAIVGGALLLHLILSAMTALYGRNLGYPFFPIFVSTVFLGFPIVLLVLTITAGRRPAEVGAPAPAVYPADR